MIKIFLKTNLLWLNFNKNSNSFIVTYMSKTDARKIRCKINVDATNFHDTFAIITFDLVTTNELTVIRYFVLLAQFYCLRCMTNNE